MLKLYVYLSKIEEHIFIEFEIVKNSLKKIKIVNEL